MANAKRTQKEIENDCKLLKEVSKIATSMKELENLTGLSSAMIRTTLSKHPIIFKRIKEQLALNQKKAELEASATVQKQDNPVCKTSLEELPAKTADCSKQPEVLEARESKISGYVIDASITGIENLREVLSKICQTKEKIILTSVTIKELEDLQKFDDIDALDARYILGLAVENSNTFESVLIDETFDTPDDCVVQYCANNKDTVTLLTSDKTMALKARMYAVGVHYFKQPENNTRVKNSNLKTLIPARRVNGALVIPRFQTANMSICVYSDGVEYHEGVRKLKIGDDVFLCSKKPGYITFAHYQIVSLFAEDNCILVYSQRLYDSSNITVPKATYKSFIKDFIHRLHL